MRDTNNCCSTCHHGFGLHPLRIIQEDIEAEENEKARDLLKKEKKRKYQACMLTHELTELSKQGKSSTSLSVDKRLTTPTSSKQQNIFESSSNDYEQGHIT